MESDYNSGSEFSIINEDKISKKIFKIEENLQNMKKDIQNEISQFDEYEKIIEDLEKEVKNLKEKKGGSLIQKSINQNYNSSVNIINSNNYYISNDSISTFKKGQDSQNCQNNQDDLDEYSFQCTNINKLFSEIYEGDNQTQIELTLKNNGRLTWPEGDAKLVFEKDPKFKCDDIILQEQEPENEKSYNVVLSDLKNIKAGKYDLYLSFVLDGIPIGDKITLSITIKSKNNDMIVIKQFRKNYNLPEEVCTDQIILEELKKYNYNENLAYVKIINILNP